MSGTCTITLEVVGADVHHLIREMDRLGPGHPRLQRNPLYDRMLRQYTKPRPPAAWVDEIASDGTRRRLRGNRTYEHAKGAGHRGVYEVYHLAPGRLYEVSEPVSGSRARRYYARVEAGQIVEVDHA